MEERDIRIMNERPKSENNDFCESNQWSHRAAAEQRDFQDYWMHEIVPILNPDASFRFRSLHRI